MTGMWTNLEGLERSQNLVEEIADTCRQAQARDYSTSKATVHNKFTSFQLKMFCRLIRVASNYKNEKYVIYVI